MGHHALHVQQRIVLCRPHSCSATFHNSFSFALMATYCWRHTDHQVLGWKDCNMSWRHTGLFPVLQYGTLCIPVSMQLLHLLLFVRCKTKGWRARQLLNSLCDRSRLYSHMFRVEPVLYRVACRGHALVTRERLGSSQMMWHKIASMRTQADVLQICHL